MRGTWRRWAWELLGRSPEIVVVSPLSQAEIIARAEAAIAEQTTTRKQRGLVRDFLDLELAKTGTGDATGFGYVDGEWDTERLYLWWRRPGGSETMSAGLYTTFEPDGAGTLLRTQVRRAPMVLGAFLVVGVIGLVVLGAAVGRAIAGLPTGASFSFGGFLLVAGVVMIGGTHLRLSGDVPQLHQFLGDCAALHRH